MKKTILILFLSLILSIDIILDISTTPKFIIEEKVVEVEKFVMVKSEPLLTSFEEYEVFVKEYKLYNSEQIGKEYWDNSTELLELAEQLKGNSVEQTIFYTQEFVGGVGYKFYFYPRGASLTLATMEGDCTDKTELMIALLMANGIYAKAVHGFENETIMHDWAEVLYPDPDIKAVSWQPLDNGTLIKVGDGVW